MPLRRPTNGAAGFKAWTDFPNDEARRRYVRYVAARYGAHNVCFSVAGEWNLVDDGPAHEKLMRELGRHLYDSDPHRRMIAIHPAPATQSGRDGGSVRRFRDEKWMAFDDYLQDYDDIHRAVVAAWRREKPVFHAGYGVYLGGSARGRTLDEMRHATWDILMGYGHFVTGFGGTHLGDGRALELDAAKERAWLDDLAHVREMFFKEVGGAAQPWRLYTHDDLISSPLGRGSDLHEPPPRKGAPYFPRTHWVRAVIQKGEGQKYLVYTRGYAGAHTLSLGAHRLNPDGVPGGTYTVRRFDPRTGAWAQLPDLKGKGPFIIKPPDARDWAFMLVLKRAPQEIKDNFEEKQ